MFNCSCLEQMTMLRKPKITQGMKTHVEKSTIIRKLLFFSKNAKKGSTSGKTLKYCTYKCKNSINLRKFHMLPKIHQYLNNVPRRPVISNCGTLLKKLQSFLIFISKGLHKTEYHILKILMILLLMLRILIFLMLLYQ